jgi:hypothetical protein
VSSERIEQCRKIMTDLLEKAAPAWYSGRNVHVKMKKEYTGFDFMLKGEILYSGFDIMTPVIMLHARIEHNRLVVTLSNDAQAHLPLPGFSRYLAERGLLSGMKKVSLQYIYAPGEPLDFACDYKAEDMVLECFFKESGEILNEISFSLVSDDFTNRIRLERIKKMLSQSLSAWFGSERALAFEFEKEDADSWDLLVLEKLSSVSLDASLDPDHRVFRWQEDTFKRECIACPLLEKAEALEIVSKAGIVIPPDMVLVGFSPAAPEEIMQCYTMRYEHRILDATEEFKKDHSLFQGKFPENYQKPGTILIEGDFFILYIDSDKKRVIGGHRKWRPVAQK